MDDKLDKLVDTLETFKENYRTYMKEVTQSNEGTFTDKVVKQQYEESVTGLDRDIVPHYAPSTVKRKRLKGQITSRVTLRDTGRMHASMTVDYDGDKGFNISSDVPYARYGTKRYTDEIWNLTTTNREELSKLYQEGLENKLRQMINDI